MATKPCVLTIAGSDSSGGAGIQADIKAISATGCYAASVITALTAQNTLGVQAIYRVPADFVLQQLESVFSDLTIAAVKIGMLENEEVIHCVATILQKYKLPFVVLDPVMMAKGGSLLLERNAIHSLQTALFPLATLLTPNLPEAEKLLDCQITSANKQAEAAKELGKKFSTNVLVKGGHFEDEFSSDVLFDCNQHELIWFHQKRIFSKHTHGTGCTLSAAIASFLAQKNPLSTAIEYAKAYLSQAIKAGSDWQIGHGIGPVDHFP